MRSAPESPHLTEDDRRHELAAILAASLIRLRLAFSDDSPPGPVPKNLADSSPNCLELPGDPRLSVHTG
jgi:hypothetical protein